MASEPQNKQKLNGLKVEIHGHAGVDVDGVLDVTEWVSMLRLGHAVTPPWDTMTIQLRLPRHLADLVLPGDVGGKHHRIHTGGWVVVRADVPTGDDKHLHGPAIGWGCIETITFGLQDVQGISNAPVQGTTPINLQCVSWFTAAGRSNIRLAISGEQSTRGGVQDATTWFPVIVEAIQRLSSNDLGQALQQIWELTGQVNVPDTIVRNLGAMSAFGRMVPVVYDVMTADMYAPSRRNACLPVRGKGLLNLPVIMPESDLWQWLGAVFVPDSNLVELFPSLEFPQLSRSGRQDKVPMTLSTTDPLRDDPEFVNADEGWHLAPPLEGIGSTGKGAAVDFGGSSGVNTSALTKLGVSLQGAQPVLVYRIKPFLMHPINAAYVGHPTVSEKLKVNQQAVNPNHVGVAREWYAVEADEHRSMSIQYSEQDRVNLTFARATYLQTGALRPYAQFGSALLPKPADFNRYGMRAYEPPWPYLPESSEISPTEASAAAAAESAAGFSGPSALSSLVDDFSALNELVWALVGEGEKFAKATLVTRAKPWCRAGHWISGDLGPVAGDGRSTLRHWTGYIEAVEHLFEVDAQARWHSYTQFQLSRVRFSNKAGHYVTPAPRPEGEQPTDQVGEFGQAPAGKAVDTKTQWIKEFVEKAKPLCAAAGFPLALCAAIAALESGWGQKAPPGSHNYFGIRWEGPPQAFVTVQTHEVINGVKVPCLGKFASFPDDTASIQRLLAKLAGGRWTAPKAGMSAESLAIWLWGQIYSTNTNYISLLGGVSSSVATRTGDASLRMNFTPAKYATIVSQLQALHAQDVTVTVVNGKQKKTISSPRRAQTEQLRPTWPL